MPRHLISIPKALICELLRCDVLVVLAGMGGVARSELVAAITSAGGSGFLSMVGLKQTYCRRCAGLINKGFATPCWCRTRCSSLKARLD
jgi:NAD(P)H-dependent flavin oxidoreductase YrpB (nitropropane dioxygenase family)